MNGTTLRDRLEEFAIKNGYRFTIYASTIIKSLERNVKKHGKPYCPCRVQKTNENACPCVHVHDDIKRQGHCHCNLFELATGDIDG